MFFPEWTTANIVFYSFVAALAVTMGASEFFNLIVLQYSKFRKKKGIHPRLGMFMVYFPPVVVALIFAQPYLRSASVTQAIVLGMIVLHFLKRVLESLFLHKYSGPIDLLSALSVSIFYSFVAGTVRYLNASRFAAWDVTFALGLTLFLIGETVNYAHHAILAKLRGNTKDYFIPRGGLFELVVCPHYLFEIIAWAGIVLASRHLFTFIAVIGMTLYLSARSIKTLKWYREKFNDFPENRKSLIPFVF